MTAEELESEYRTNVSSYNPGATKDRLDMIFRALVEILRELQGKEQKQAKDFLSRIKELETGIEEVLDGTLPYLAEKRLQELLEEK